MGKAAEGAETPWLSTKMKMQKKYTAYRLGHGNVVPSVIEPDILQIKMPLCHVGEEELALPRKKDGFVSTKRSR